jgi:hypothetical protein
MESLEVPSSVLDFRFRKKLVGIQMEKTSPAPTNTPLPSRTAVYVRMSTEHQQYSPDNQLGVIRQYTASHSMEIVQVYSDHGRSGLDIVCREGLNQSMSGMENKAANFSALLADVSGIPSNLRCAATYNSPE